MNPITRSGAVNQGDVPFCQTQEVVNGTVELAAGDGDLKVVMDCHDCQQMFLPPRGFEAVPLPRVVVRWFPVLGLGATTLPSPPSIWPRGDKAFLRVRRHNQGGDFWKSLCFLVLSMAQVMAGAARMARTDTNP